MLGAAEPGVEILYKEHTVHKGTELQSDKRDKDNIRTAEQSNWHSFYLNQVTQKSN